MLRRRPRDDDQTKVDERAETRRTTQASLTLPPAQTPTMRRPSGRDTPDDTGTRVGRSLPQERLSRQQ
jgi:hypothetical protein